MEAVRFKCQDCQFVSEFFEGESVAFICAREHISCEECDSKNIQIVQDEEVIE